jgi:trans-aconitate methyltransferase
MTLKRMIITRLKNLNPANKRDKQIPLEDTEKVDFLDDYLKRLRDAYPISVDGRVLLKIPSL